VFRRILVMVAIVLGVQVWSAPAAEAAGNEAAAAMTLWGVTADRPWDATTAEANCGGVGQVACINTDLTYATPYDGCNTDRMVNILNFCAKCGGVGDLVCKYGSKCDAGGREISGICVYSGYSSEPTPNVSVMPVLTQPATGPVRGIVDLHAHQFSNLGFGGVVFWGAPYDAGGINEALPWCDYTWKFSTKMALTGAPGPTVPFLGHEVHGSVVSQPFANPIGVVMGEGLHDPAGTGSFAGWPTYKTMTHQQMYYTWVERAFLGGVRMMVQLAVSNEALCGMSKIRSDFTCNDMEAVDRQMQATKDLERAIDQMDDGLINGSGWYRIAYSPAQARALIRSGKMAVVLGVEVDSLFNCKPGVTCSEAFLRKELQKYYDIGVRHVFPIHQYDNGFGGAAIFRDELNSANRVVAGHHFRVRDCSAQGYSYNVNSSLATDFLSLLLHGAEFPDQNYYDQFAADCNELGLTATGRTLINAMMDMGFIIDVDHMSRLMLDDVLAIAQARNYPLVSGHSTLRGGQGGAEYSLTDAQMAAMRQIGGMVSAINPKGECNTSSGFSYHYKHAVQGMQSKPGDRFAAVGLATDMNGFGGSTSPRFGIPSCPGAAGTELHYPFQGILGGTFNIQQTGDRSFDFNYQGLAHYGLLADFFADVRNNFLTQDEFEPLLNSAESYIRMWARATPGETTPTVRAVVTGTQDSRGFGYVSDVRVRWEITGSDSYDLNLSGCQERVITQDTPAGGLTFTCTAEAYYEDTDNARVVVGSKGTSVTIVRDTTPPTVTWGAAPWTLSPGWYNRNIEYPYTVSDVGVGVEGRTSDTVVFSEEGVGLTRTVTVTDYVGNSATYTSPAVNIDKTAPAIVFVGPSSEANAAGWHRENLTLTWACADDLSGPVDNQVQRSLINDGADQTATGLCRDRAGNEATDRRTGFNLDKTPPTLEWTTPAANAAGWYNTDVAITFTTDDAVSGVAGTSQASPLVLTSDGDAVTGTVTVTDVAGNSATFTSPVVRIDKTPPTLVWAAASPAANAAGWHNSDVTWAFTTNDEGSGVAGTSQPSPVVLTSEGAAVTGTVTVTDVAGNTATFTSPVVRIDRTPPVVTCVASPGVLWPPNNRMVPISVDLSVTDVLSGGVTYVMTEASSNEPGAAIDIAGFTVSGQAVKGAVRAQRNGNGTGRVYTLSYQGMDLAGNTASCTTTVTVPHSR